MITLGLLAPPETDIRKVAEILRCYGFDVRIVILAAARSGKECSKMNWAVLISPESEIIHLGEELTRLVEMLPKNTPVLVCAPLPVRRDGKLLSELGASAMVEPAGWGATEVAERILAELALEGCIEPAESGPLKGVAAAMRKVYKEISTIASINDSVLILGETGAGKGLVADEIHRLSGRPGELMAINVAALSPELMASDLFGHERGAFTGAATKRNGLLAEAKDGTVFLDEIGDLDLQSQAKLLRVLEDLRVRPVGSNRWQPIESRIIMATNHNLEEACQEGRFRRDLYERIRGMPIHVPPLRDHKIDIPLLAHHFLRAFNEENGGNRSIPHGALEPLFRHDWPGNVRELRQAIRQAAAFAPSPDGPISKERLRETALGSRVYRPQKTLSDGDLSPGSGLPSFFVAFDPEKDSLHDLRNRAESHYLRSLLEITGGDKAAAAKRAGISLSRLYDLLKKS